MSVDVAAIAGEADVVLQALEKYAPFLFGILKFTPIGPEAAIAEPFVEELMNKLDEAAKAVSAGHPGEAGKVVLTEIMDHIDPAKAFVSPILSGVQQTATPPST